MQQRGPGERPGPTSTTDRPLVVMYLYVHDPSEAFVYPSARAGRTAERVARRYLECAVAQAASLRLQDAGCDIALATNMRARELGPAADTLTACLLDLGVAILEAPYLHRPNSDVALYVSSRYVLDAIVAATEGRGALDRLYLTDLDCIWVDPARVFAAAPPAPAVGCIHIGYPPDWDVVGVGAHRTRRSIGELAAQLGGPGELPRWVGGELFAGTVRSLRALVATAEATDAELARAGQVLPMEEQLFSLIGARAPLSFTDLGAVAGRVQTGPRHAAESDLDPLALGLWHLPGEKGLSLRRAATAVRRGRTGRLREALEDPKRAGAYFNVAGSGPARRVRDDAWILGQRVASVFRG
jgi:hypothetical protein